MLIQEARVRHFRKNCDYFKSKILKFFQIENFRIFFEIKDHKIAILFQINCTNRTKNGDFYESV